MELKKWPRLNELVGAASGTRKQLNAKITELQADTSRLPEWRKEQINKQQAKAAQEISTLRSEFYEEYARLKAEKLQEAFGLVVGAGDVITKELRAMSLRDAALKADALSDIKDAAQMYRTARNIGDELLQSAVAFKAYGIGWRNIVNEHFDGAPTRRREALEQYRALVSLEETPQNKLELRAAFRGAESGVTAMAYGSLE